VWLVEGLKGGACGVRRGQETGCLLGGTNRKERKGSDVRGTEASPFVYRGSFFQWANTGQTLLPFFFYDIQYMQGMHQMGSTQKKSGILHQLMNK
jgi:hypothetical protein